MHIEPGELLLSLVHKLNLKVSQSVSSGHVLSSRQWNEEGFSYQNYLAVQSKD